MPCCHVVLKTRYLWLCYKRDIWYIFGSSRWQYFKVVFIIHSIKNWFFMFALNDFHSISICWRYFKEILSLTCFTVFSLHGYLMNMNFFSLSILGFSRNEIVLSPEDISSQHCQSFFFLSWTCGFFSEVFHFILINFLLKILLFLSFFGILPRFPPRYLTLSPFRVSTENNYHQKG